MTTIARRIAATPVRTASDTWQFITDLVSVAGGDVATGLSQAADVVSMLIAEEHTAANPIVLSGCGPQVRIYTVHGTDAIEGSQLNEQALMIIASDDWHLNLPASGSDHVLALASLNNVANIDVYDPSDPNDMQSAATQLQSRRTVTIDLTALEH